MTAPCGPTRRPPRRSRSWLVAAAECAAWLLVCTAKCACDAADDDGGSARDEPAPTTFASTTSAPDSPKEPTSTAPIPTSATPKPDTREAPPEPLPEEPPPVDPAALHAFMLGEIAPRFADSSARDELLELLREVPAYAVDPEMSAAWQEIIDAMPDEGPLAPSCETCHSEHRLRFRASVGRLDTRGGAGKSGSTP